MKGRPTFARYEGMTLIELLVAGAIFVVLLVLVSSFFIGQLRVSQAVQERTAAQNDARIAIHIVSNDLLSAGASFYVRDGNMTGPVAIGQPIVGTSSEVAVAYVTSLRPSLAESCRNVAYRLQNETLERSDVVCGDAPVYHTIADNVLAFELAYVCSDAPDSVVATPETCSTDRNAYVRSIVVSVMTQSGQPLRVTSDTVTFTSRLDSGNTVTCPANRSCTVLQQEVLTPNLKPD